MQTSYVVSTVRQKGVGRLLLCMKHPINNKQVQLFVGPREHGHREWSTFNAVRGDSAGMYRVHTPQIAQSPRYPNAVHIRRYRDTRYLSHPLVLRGARWLTPAFFPPPPPALGGRGRK